MRLATGQGMPPTSGPGMVMTTNPRLGQLPPSKVGVAPMIATAVPMSVPMPVNVPMPVPMPIPMPVHMPVPMPVPMPVLVDPIGSITAARTEAGLLEAFEVVKKNTANVTFASVASTAGTKRKQDPAIWTPQVAQEFGKLLQYMKQHGC